MNLFATDVRSADFLPTDTEQSFLRRIQSRRFHAYARIAESIMFLATAVGYVAYVEPVNKILAATFFGSALMSLVIRKLFDYQGWLPRYANQATFMSSVLYMFPAMLSTILRPENENGRALVLVGLAISSYCFSLRWFAANQIALGLMSMLAWSLTDYTFGADDALVLLIAVPAVGLIICLNQLESLKRAFQFQKESSDRQQELEFALKLLTEETELRREEERRRVESEERLKEQQQQLLHVSRLTTMGELLASIAHELHQPMHATSMYAGVLEVLAANDSSPQQKKLRECSDKIVALTQQSATTVRRLQNFVRRGPRVRVQTDLSEIIQDALELTAAEMRHLGVQLEVQATEEGFRVEVDPVQIQQVLVNLLRNSCEAMAETPHAERRITVAMRAAGEQIELSVADTGSGLSSTVAARVFETFYSTKNEGLGMGLAISRSILEDHRGSIDVVSEVGQGATFRLFLPALSSGLRN